MARTLPASGREERHQLTIAFFFQAARTFQDKYHTTRADTIEVNCWQAGADPDDVLLGVSFATKRQILLNTIHILVPGQSRTWTLDAGITSTSRPDLARKQSSAPGYK